MKPKDLLTEEFLTEQCIKLGKSGCQIAKENNLNAMTVYNYIKRYGIDKPRDRFNNLELDKDFNQGLSVQEIADKHKLSYTAVYNRIRHLIKKNTDLLTYEVLYKDRVVNEMMLKDIAKKYRVSEPSVRKKCKEYGIDHTRKCITKLIDEEDVRRMYVDEKMSIQEIAAHYDTVYCGTLLYHMKKWGMTKDKSDLSKKQIKRWGDNDKNDFVPSLFLRSVKRRAKRKNIPYDLTADFILNMYIRQNGKCAISGMDISLPKNNDEYAKHLHTVSVDRIDSNKGYTKNNVQLLHKDINRMKWSHSEEYFLSLCENIYQNQTK